MTNFNNDFNTISHKTGTAKPGYRARIQEYDNLQAKYKSKPYLRHYSRPGISNNYSMTNEKFTTKMPDINKSLVTVENKPKLENESFYKINRRSVVQTESARKHQKQKNRLNSK